MWQTLVSLGILGADYAYHRWISPPAPPKPPGQVNIPTTTQGTPVPLIYGQVRVNSPILIWTSEPKAMDQSFWNDSSNQLTLVFGNPPQFAYYMDYAVVCGIPPTDGDVSVVSCWSGQGQRPIRPVSEIEAVTAYPAGTYGGYFVQYELPIYPSRNFLAAGAGTGLVPDGMDGWSNNGLIELLDGHSTQDLFDGSGNPTCNFGDRMLASSGIFPFASSLRGYVTILMFGWETHTPWLAPMSLPDIYSNFYMNCVGTSPSMTSMSYEVRALPADTLAAPAYPVAINATDMNPIDVLFDLLTGDSDAKCGLSTSVFDLTAWSMAAQTVASEGNGFSRIWDSTTSVSDIINEIDQQVDGGMYEDPSTGLIGYMLVRPDFDPTKLQNINPSNCIRIEGFTLGGWTDVPNVVQVNFTDRGNGYQQSAAIAANQANAVSQSARIVSNVNLPGVTTLDLASMIANRELTAQSRPLAKCSAYVSRDFLRVKIGDPLTLTWPEVGISGMVMRVAAIDRGTLASGTIKLDLIQDYFYQWKRNPPVQLGGFNYGGTVGDHR